jgi:DNA-binding SARP family transcriptional activator
MRTGNDENINVTLLGEFSITINGRQLTNLIEPSKRVLMLIEYLIANRQQTVPISKLTEVIWGENECGDPLNALKNLVYRARGMLKVLPDSRDAEYIQFIQDTYVWNNTYSCTIDTEQLVALWKQGTDTSKFIDERIVSLEEAIKLYRGNFLSTSPSNSWIVDLASYYCTIYIDCALQLCRLLLEMECFGKTIRVCETALEYAPLEEEIHKTLLQAYIATGQRNKALDHYDSAVNLFYKEQGKNISDSMHRFYSDLISGIDQIEPDLFIIKNHLIEAESISCAYYCEYDVFKSIYRIQARSIKRIGQSIYIILFTLRDQNGEIPSNEVIQNTVKQLKCSIIENLRKGDVVAAYSSTQFIAMLALDNYDNAENVADRILRKFQLSHCMNDVKIRTRINAMDPVE